MTKSEARAAVADYINVWGETRSGEHYTDHDASECLEDLNKDMPDVVKDCGVDSAEIVKGWIHDQLYEVGNRNRLERLVNDPRS